MTPPLPTTPSLPERIEGLAAVAANLAWSWSRDARALFRARGGPRWLLPRHNPVEILRRVDPARLAACAADPAFLRLYDDVVAAARRLETAAGTWFATTHVGLGDRPVAYFCAEFGLHASVPIYSGGLGVLAGDHCKAASDLGVPLVAVGLLYTKGYSDQRLRLDGWQEDAEERFDVATTPLEVRAAQGDPCVATVRMSGREVGIGAWRLMVGRVPIFLLDTDLERNAPADRGLSPRLYAGGQELRLRQEWILGVGGVRVLRALGYDPAVWHANEGHAAFMLVERVRELISGGTPLDDAVRRVRATSVFTTHTPLAAAHDHFSPEQIEQVSGPMWQAMGISKEQFLRLGRHLALDHDRFHMPVAAIRLSARVNAVSRRHGEESRRIWAPLWPDRDPATVTIGFGRRFATYKRADLIFRDAERLQRLLVDPRRPVQIVFAGKAHPADEPGKQVLQRVYGYTREARFEGRIAFLEDYDTHIAHLLVQGVDLWLNVPRVPLEACGTSGMKAALNGVPQIGTLDGWWAEGYDGFNGWAIPPAEAGQTTDAVDAADAQHLYRLLEGEVVPLFYDREPGAVPHRWVEKMKHAMYVAGRAFPAQRMVRQYVTEHYVPAMRADASADDPPTA